MNGFHIGDRVIHFIPRNYDSGRVYKSKNVKTHIEVRGVIERFSDIGQPIVRFSNEITKPCKPHTLEKVNK